MSNSGQTMIKSYSVHTIPPDTQPKEYALGWLRKVLQYAQVKETEEDYDIKTKGHKVFFTLRGEDG